MGVRRGFLAASVLVVAQVFASGAWADDGRGEELFKLCESCHGPDAGGNQKFLAPAIAGMDAWYLQVQLEKFRSGARGRHFDDLSGMRMRPMALTLRTDEDVKAVVGYVASLPSVNPAPTLEGGDATRGQALYGLCGSCHGAAGEGSQVLNGPPLAHTSDWYVLSQLQKFKSGVRGSNPADPIAIMMRPMALTLADEQAMYDVIAYIMTLSR